MKLFSAPMGARPQTRRPWLRWLLLGVFVVALAIAFVNLGRWQLSRLDQRRSSNQTVIDHENLPVVDFAKAFGGTVTDEDQWQRVQVKGTFDAGHQYLVRYRSNGDQSGYEVVTPLRTTSGSSVLVDRGFAVRPPDQDFPTTLPAPPSGEVTIIGYVRRDEEGPVEAITPTQNSVRLISSAGIGPTLPYPVVNGYLSVLEITPEQGGDLTAVQPPALTEGNHFSYAVQWFLFAGIAGIGLVLLIRSDLRTLREPVAAPAPDEGEKS